MLLALCLAQVPGCQSRAVTPRLSVACTASRLATLRGSALCRAMLPCTSRMQRPLSASAGYTGSKGLAVPARHQHHQHSQQQQQARGSSIVVQSQKHKAYSFEVEVELKGTEQPAQVEQVRTRGTVARVSEPGSMLSS